MGAIPQNVIDDIRQRADIVRVISEYIPLKKAGANFKALCPFHEEKTPSFNVNTAKQIFHCFGCQEGGNAISFVMKYENVSFPEAVRVLAANMGIEIESRDAKADGEIERIYSALKAASEFFRARLEEAPETAPAREYMKKRNIDPQLAGLFGLGWAPDEWEALTGHLLKKGFELKTIEKAGLCKPSSKGNAIDRFRGRLIFPICNAGGKPIAFAGRVLDESRKDAPKYLNSPETPVYSKSRVLYGLHLAQQAARRADSLIIVEGYMDVIALRAAGVENTVAVAGVAFTPRQAEAIKRTCENAVILFDTDEAGIKAAQKSIPVLLDQGLKVKALSLPGAKDPDEFIGANGPEKFGELAKHAPAFAEFVIDTVLAKADLNDIGSKTEAAREVIPFLKKIKDGIERSQYAQLLAERARIDPKVIEKEVNRSIPQQGAPAGPRGAEQKTSARSLAEKILIRILLDRPEYLDSYASALAPDDFSNKEYMEIFRLILLAREREVRTISEIVDMAGSEGLGGQLAGISVEKDLFDEEKIEKVAQDCVNRIKYSPQTRKNSLQALSEAAERRDSESFKKAEKKYIESRPDKL